MYHAATIISSFYLYMFVGHLSKDEVCIILYFFNINNTFLLLIHMYVEYVKHRDIFTRQSKWNCIKNFHISSSMLGLIYVFMIRPVDRN